MRGRQVSGAPGAVVLTRAQFDALFPRALQAGDCYAAMLVAFERFGISTPLRQAHFLAQIGHESGGLARPVESFAYSPERALAVFGQHFRDLDDARAVVARGQQAIAERVYGGRLGNGPEGTGDGWRYRGRGWFQLTGRDNYAGAGGALNLDLLSHPQLAELPTPAARIAGRRWAAYHCSFLADGDDIRGITRAINGGLNGLDDRRLWLALAKRALGVA